MNELETGTDVTDQQIIEAMQREIEDLEAQLGQLDRIIHDPETSDDEKWDAAIAILDGEKT